MIQFFCAHLKMEIAHLIFKIASTFYSRDIHEINLSRTVKYPVIGKRLNKMTYL